MLNRALCCVRGRAPEPRTPEPRTWIPEPGSRRGEPGIENLKSVTRCGVGIRDSGIRERPLHPRISRISADYKRQLNIKCVFGPRNDRPEPDSGTGNAALGGAYLQIGACRARTTAVRTGRPLGPTSEPGPRVASRRRLLLATRGFCLLNRCAVAGRPLGTPISRSALAACVQRWHPRTIARLAKGAARQYH
jgi:hypothetical protein